MRVRGLAIVAFIVASVAVVKSMQAAPQLTTLWSFGCGGNDGCYPYAPALLDNEGALYGTARFGGIPCIGIATSIVGCGVVFKLTLPTAGQTQWTETVLYKFTGGSDGGYPLGGLIMDHYGALYGTTDSAGTLGKVLFFDWPHLLLVRRNGPKPCCTTLEAALTLRIPRQPKRMTREVRPNASENSQINPSTIVRVARVAGSHPHLASGFQGRRKIATINLVSESSGECRLN
jgi:hypothetical protein